jgi:hypothetical protein
LLNNIIHNVVKEVVPWKAEEEILGHAGSDSESLPMSRGLTYQYRGHDLILHKHNFEIITNDRLAVRIELNVGIDVRPHVFSIGV